MPQATNPTPASPAAPPDTVPAAEANSAAPAQPPRGLSAQEVQSRRAQGLNNTPPPSTSRTYFQIVRENVLNFINIAIFVLGAALVLVGRPMDALLSVGIICLNILVSLVQEIRAKRILDKVALLTRPQACVVRDGQEQQVKPEDLVQGDVLKVGPGDQVVLDGRVLYGRMSVDESQLTGESDLIRKEVGNQVFSGSFCVSGAAYYEAQKVGEESMANKMTANARAYRRMTTPLQHQIGIAVRLILFMVIYLQILLLANSLLNAVPLPTGVAQATVFVSLVPNGLFLSIAIAYALAAVRMVRFGALLQQSNAVESLSNVDVLCLDKTGTLTTNKLHFDQALAWAGTDDELKQTLGVMIASAASQNKTSEAIATVCQAPAQKTAAEVPFSSARKWSAVAFNGSGPGSADSASGSASGSGTGSGAGGLLRGVYALGAEEFLRPYLKPLASGSTSGSTSGDGPDSPHGNPGAASTGGDAIRTRVAHYTDQGLRVLLVAYHPDPTLLHDDGDATKLPSGMTPLGMVTISDELRAEAKAALEGFIESGVNPKIISGDSPETVAALARQAGFTDPKLVSGLELEGMDDASFDTAAATGDIFGRITPQQKERLVDALRRRGHYVAMIGDGVNDVLSLKKANLGIAMQSGSQATRGVADIILVNDSFAALQPAVKEGQRIVNGMQDILKLFLTRIATMMLVIVSAWTIGLFPIAVRQGTFVTLLTVGIPTVMLAIWARPGMRYHTNLVRRLAHFVLPPSFLASVLGLIVFYVPLGLGLTPEARNMGAEQFLTTFAPQILAAQTALSVFLIGAGLFLVIFVEPPTAWWTGGDALSGDWRPTYLAAGLAAAAVIVLLVPDLRAFFDLAPLTPLHVALILGCLAVWFVLLRLIWRRQWLEKWLGLA
jgi:cation-transporting ATPase E